MGIKVLLADDSDNIRKLVEMAFSDTDFELLAVPDGRQAVEQLASFQPDIILADTIMPQLDGYEVCRQVKADPQFAKIPVVLLTGRFQQFDEEKAQAAHIDGRLIKPFAQEQLIGTINGLVSKEDEAATPEQVPPEAAETVADDSLAEEAIADDDLFEPVADEETRDTTETPVEGDYALDSNATIQIDPNELANYLAQTRAGGMEEPTADDSEEETGELVVEDEDSTLEMAIEDEVVEELPDDFDLQDMDSPVSDRLDVPDEALGDDTGENFEVELLDDEAMDLEDDDFEDDTGTVEDKKAAPAAGSDTILAFEALEESDLMEDEDILLDEDEETAPPSEDEMLMPPIDDEPIAPPAVSAMDREFTRPKEISTEEFSPFSEEELSDDDLASLEDDDLASLETAAGAVSEALPDHDLASVDDGDAHEDELSLDDFDMDDESSEPEDIDDALQSINFEDSDELPKPEEVDEVNEDATLTLDPSFDASTEFEDEAESSLDTAEMLDEEVSPASDGRFAELEDDLEDSGPNFEMATEMEAEEPGFSASHMADDDLADFETEPESEESALVVEEDSDLDLDTIPGRQVPEPLLAEGQFDDADELSPEAVSPFDEDEDMAELATPVEESSDPIHFDEDVAQAGVADDYNEPVTLDVDSDYNDDLEETDSGLLDEASFADVPTEEVDTAEQRAAVAGAMAQGSDFADNDTKPMKEDPQTDAGEIEEIPFDEPLPVEEVDLEEETGPIIEPEFETAPSLLDTAEETDITEDSGFEPLVHEEVSMPATGGDASEAVAVMTPAPNGSKSNFPLNEAQMDQLANEIAKRVIEKLTGEAVSDIAWQVVPELAEAMIKKRIFELEHSAEDT